MEKNGLAVLAMEALEHQGSGFTLMRAVRCAGEVVDWDVLHVNRFTRDLWLGPTFQPGIRLSSVVKPADQPALWGLQREALASGTRQEGSMFVNPPFGGAAWRRGAMIPVDTDVVAMISHDICDVVELEARVAALSEHVWDIVAMTDADAVLTWISPSVERILGFPAPDLVGRSAADLVFPDDLDATMARFAEVIADPDASGTPIEVRVVDVDGRPRWFECVGVNQLDNPTLHGLVVSLHDIDARKTTEAALRGSELRTRSIVETAGDGIITLDQDGIIETFNRAAERMFETTADAVVGTFYADLIPVPAADHLRAQLALRGGTTAEPIEVMGRRRGEDLPVQVSLSATMIDERLVYTAIVRDITRQHQIERQLEHMALHDDLTGLPNRRRLVESLRATIARPATAGHVFGLLSLDLDDFKLANDTLGADVGDRLLMHVAARVGGVLGAGDILARPGGDEFIVLCDVRSGVDALVSLATRITESLRPAFEVGRHEVFVSASIGIVAWQGGDATSVELLRNADTAMHRAKKRGRGQIEVFDHGMRIELAARLGLESALQRALERNELRAFYQPIVVLDDGRIVKQEALVRWLRPDVGLVTPTEFIEVAEETGLIVPIGEWMLHQATHDAAEWQEQRPGVGVSVNVSGRQLDRSDLASAVAQTLRTSGLPAHLLTLEITESVLLRDADRMMIVLSELRALGVRIAVDDFGTGYSSLTYLHRFPIDELKIDGSFIRALEAEGPESPLLAMMIQLGATLGLDTVAEGIDAQHRLDVVRRLGCTYGQGYLSLDPPPSDLVA